MLHLTEGILSVKELLETARSYGTTLTVYLTAVYLCAIAQDMSEKQKKKPVALMIPVNLRNYFPSDSVRNFFGWIDIDMIFPARVKSWKMLSRLRQNFLKKS